MLRMEELETLPEQAAAELLDCSPEDVERIYSTLGAEADIVDDRAADDVIALSEKGLEAEVEYILSQFESYQTVPEILEELDFRLDDSIWRRAPIVETESSVLIGA